MSSPTTSVDVYKLMHWLNARKLTPTHLRELTGLELDLPGKDAPEEIPLAMADVRLLAKALNVAPDKLTAGGGRQPAVIHQSAAETEATRRAVWRDNIHFYNYYSLPAPTGWIAPVVLDILCPQGRLPKLNNGHLEPAITINIGPGDIFGRWGTDINELTWARLAANHDGDPAWIIGDSYLEPSYRPHSYALATAEPARIISYTCKSNLQALLALANHWPDPVFDRFVEDWSADAHAAMLAIAATRRGFTVAALASAAGISRQHLDDHLAGDTAALDLVALRRLGAVLGLDYRLLLPPAHQHDAIGKTSCSIEQSRATIREFHSYTVASMAAAPQLPDLVGLFMRVDRSAAQPANLVDHGASHYLATDGSMIAWWLDTDGTLRRQRLNRDDSLWVGPCVPHGFTGNGSLIKLGNGEGYGYLDQVELTNTVERTATLRRSRHDRADWGYDQPTA
ncbi:histidine kinase [Goodfellowiella coeruleoviolacea]|uniref:HTH cro/C1-type domain-containing protein n=1 Tax=Goodfellowiella coeruleoviolacea TaxID=334858 RepID=A0AAE3KFD1_9PSEU|nr:histidine kinase [Goodfellowiella coeruleoviolacea]MCP2164299.1 hypothetical protein [Goodfellowiella coeruleoviolacea]